MLITKKCWVLLVLLFVPFQVQIFAQSTSEKRAYRVLFLSSYHLSFPTGHYQLEGVLNLKRLQADYESVDIDVEYMNTKRYTVSERTPHVYRDLKNRVESMGNYDVIISADDNALHFLTDYKDELFGEDTPVVFFGINNHEFANIMAEQPDYTGIVESASLLDTVELGFGLFPDTEKLHVIVDSTTSGQSDLDYFKETIPSEFLDKCVYENLSNLSYQELAGVMGGYTEKDLILLLSAYCDRTGVRKNFRQALMWLNENVNRPVFHPYRHGVGDGLVGGRVVSHKKMAEMAVSYAQRILHGESPENLKLINESTNIYLLDYKQLQRYGARFDSLSGKDVTFLNRPATVYERHQNAFVIFLLAFIILIIFSLTLSYLFMKQRQTLLELEESEDRTRSLFDNSVVPMLILDPVDFTIVDVNPAALLFYGYDYKDIVNASITIINELSIETIREKMKMVEGGEDYKFQFKHRLANGEIRDVDVLTTQVYRKQKPLLFTIVQDTTERKAWEKEIIEARNNAIAVSRHKDEFLAMMSHEMRTPLNPILGFTSLLLDMDKDEESIRYLELIQKSANQMLRLVDNILNYSKMRGGHFTPCSSDFCLLDFVEEVVEEYEKCSQGNKIVYTNGISGFEALSEDIYVNTDCYMLHQILDNLVFNSCKYTENGVIRIFSAIESENKDLGEILIRFEVHDNGIGISKDMQGKLFQPFTQEDSSFTREYEGAGLGLAITQEIIKKLGGEIGLTSELGEGSMFWFHIPMKTTMAEDVVEHDMAEKETVLTNTKQSRILVVEDNVDNAEFIKSTIKPYSIDVEVAQNGEEGVYMASFNQYDLILMDLSMPLMDGVTATKHIRANLAYKTTPIIAYTANATEAAKQTAYQAGVDDVLIKPLSPSTLSKKLLSYLGE